MFLPIYLNDEPDITLVDKLGVLIGEFPVQSYKEILDFFPREKEEHFKKSLSIAEHIGFIKKQEYMGEEYYTRGKRYKKEDFSQVWRLREKYLSSLDFIRMLVNSTDDEGYLINEITYINKGSDPCTIFFVCNQILRELYYIPESQIRFYVDYIQTRDYQIAQEKNDFVPDNSRIVIINNESYIKDIKFRNIAYFAIYDEEERIFTIRKGTNL